MICNNSKLHIDHHFKPLPTVPCSRGGSQRRFSVTDGLRQVLEVLVNVRPIVPPPHDQRCELFAEDVLGRRRLLFAAPKTAACDTLLLGET